MITKIAFLNRLFPRLPTVTSAGYTMPRERFFFYGISFSAALHAAVLFGVNPPKPPPPGDPVEKPVDVVLAFTFTPEEPPPPPEPDPEAKKGPSANDPADVGEDYSRLPTPTLPTFDPSIVLPGERPDIGRMPDKNALRWDPPRNPAGPGTSKNREPIFTKDELDKVPVATNRVAPRYPFEMKREGRSGTVVMRFVVDDRGDVTDVEVISSPSAEFAKAAVEAMLRWKFRPGVKNFKKVNTRMEMPMAFSLAKDA